VKNAGKRFLTAPKWLVFCGWTAATLTCLASIFGLAEYFPVDGKYMPLDLNAWYTALHRIGWSISISWIIYACAFGAGGPVDYILSWAPFASLGRLTYAAYLTHLFFIGWYKGTRKAGEYIDLPMQVFTFVGYHICGHLAGYLFSMVFEVPFMRLEKIVLPFDGNARASPTQNNKKAVEANEKDQEQTMQTDGHDSRE
jgi:peptidoglycan/LPS O-acetylase OafA/YrhL